MVKSRFDINSSKTFISHLRSFLINNGLGDPYRQVLKKPITIDLSEAMEDMPEGTQAWIKELQSILKLELFDSKFNLTIEGLGYAINDFNTEFLPLSSSNANRVEYVTHNHLRGLRLHADKIAFEIELNQGKKKNPIKFQVLLNQPEFIIDSSIQAELPMGWLTSVEADRIKLVLHTINLESVFSEIVKQPHLIDFNTQGLVLPEVSIKVGRKVVSLDHAKLMAFLVKREEELKDGILSILKTHMNSKFSNIIKDSPREISAPKNLAFNNVINGFFSFFDMKANFTRLLEFNLGGFFCETAITIPEKSCPGKIPTKLRREIDHQTYERSSRLLNRLLIENAANIALSVSEDYLNQLIQATIKGGLWDDVLSQKNLRLGPETVFVLAEERGNTFSLYLDVIHRLSRTQRILVGRSELRFPVKLKISLKIEEIDGIPNFKIIVKEVATDRNTILNGVAEYNLISDVRNVPRFRSKVVNTILNDVGDFADEELIQIELSELKGSYFQKLNFFSDGMGRANATLNFNTNLD